MRILLAPDKFRDCLTAARVVEAIAIGVRQADPSAEIDSCPMADGGEGTVDALVAATGGRFEIRRVTGPLAEMKVEAKFAVLGDGKTAVIEMSAASGLSLVKPEDRNPMNATTFGTGELLMAAAEMGVEKIILGIGGSATIDGGIGAAQACGLPVILQDGQPVPSTEPLTAADLEKVVLIKHGRGSPIEKIKIVVAADVNNPLCGELGAARIFGPQKGATPWQIEKLDADLLELARRTGKLSIAKMPGAGAAGGLGFGMMAFFGAELCRGVDLVIDAVRLRERLRGVNLCFTGEGRLDAQSLSGKTVAGVAAVCREANVPCIAIAGTVESGVDFAALGIQAIPICRDGMTIDESIANAFDLIALQARAVCSERFRGGPII
jgi:glycerate 2-kinase